LTAPILDWPFRFAVDGIRYVVTHEPTGQVIAKLHNPRGLIAKLKERGDWSEVPPKPMLVYECLPPPWRRR
jgi:hypothetical protein